MNTVLTNLRSALRLGVAVVCLVLVTGPPARADNVLQNGVFSTTGQSIWQPGTALVNVTPGNQFFGVSWGAAGPATSPAVPVPVPPLGGTLSVTGALNPGRV